MSPQSRRIADFIAPQLEAGEHVEVVLAACQAGPTPVVVSVFGAIGALLVTHFYAVAVTDRRVFLIRRGWRGPKLVEQAYPRVEVGVKGFKPAVVYGVFRLVRPVAGELTLSFPRVFRSEAEAVAKALGGTPM